MDEHISVVGSHQIIRQIIKNILHDFRQLLEDLFVVLGKLGKYQKC